MWQLAIYWCHLVSLHNIPPSTFYNLSGAWTVKSLGFQRFGSALHVSKLFFFLSRKQENNPPAKYRCTCTFHLYNEVVQLYFLTRSQISCIVMNNEWRSNKSKYINKLVLKNKVTIRFNYSCTCTSVFFIFPFQWRIVFPSFQEHKKKQSRKPSFLQ